MIGSMSDRPKKQSKVGKAFNDARNSRKAWKKADRSRNRRSPQDPVTLVLMGKGQYVNIHRSTTKGA